MTLYVATRNFLASRVLSLKAIADKSGEWGGCIDANEILMQIDESVKGKVKVIGKEGKIYYVNSDSIEKWLTRIDLHEDVHNQKCNLYSKNTFI